MTYKEAMMRSKQKLLKWDEVGSEGYRRFYNPSEKIYLDVNKTRTYINAEGVLRLTSRAEDCSSAVCRVEDLFRDPFNVSKEEAALFRLEHGFDYPKELVDGL